jgi:hypothetical protein
MITLASLTILTEDAGAYSRAKALLAEAERLIEESGACIYEGRLNEARTLLADFSR